MERIKRTRPSVEDYVAEGVIDHAPEPDSEGKIDMPIRGHERVVRALQMNEEANRMEAWHFDNRREQPMRASRLEAAEERKARKFHTPRATIVVPEMPWKRKRGKKEAE